MNKHISKKVAIVTGASSGIGNAIVLELIKKGFRVHAAARRVEMMKLLEEAGAAIHQLDLQSSQGISEFVRNVVEREKRIDLLVNNAGYGAYGSIEEVPLREARDQFDVNLFAAAQLIQEVLPTMRQQRSGKIVNVSSIAGKLWTPLGGWYNASKFALEGLSDCLRNEVRPFGIDVVIVEPGAIKTEWTGIALASMMKNSGQGPYSFIARSFQKLASSSYAARGSVPPEVIAQLIASIATVARPRARYVAPFSGTLMLFLRWLLSDRLFDALWCKIFGITSHHDHGDGEGLAQG